MTFDQVVALAVLVAVVGVLMIVRPGMAGFEPASLLALIAVGGLAVRDLSTRRMPRHVASHLLSGSAYGVMVPGGLALAALAQGLTDEQANTRSTVSELTVGGLIKHVAATEKEWAPWVWPFQRATRARPWAMSSISMSNGDGSSRSRRRPDSMRCQARGAFFLLGRSAKSSILLAGGLVR